MDETLTVSFWTVAPRPGLIAKATILRKSFTYEKLRLNPPWSLRFTFVAPQDDDGMAHLQRLCDTLLTHCYTGSTTVLVGFLTHKDVCYLRFGNAYVLSMSPIKTEDRNFTVECLLKFYDEPTQIEHGTDLV